MDGNDFRQLRAIRRKGRVLADPCFTLATGCPNLSAPGHRRGETMKSILALCLILWSSTTLAAQPVGAPANAVPACDRECLRGKITEVLYALAEHDVSKLAVAPTLRVTEDAVEKPLAQVSLVVRVKVDSEQKLSELELVATRSRADGMIFKIDAYSGAPARAMNVVPRPAQLATREQAIEIAMYYPRGLSNAKTFNAVGTPFAKGASRLENGALMAGPGCTFAAGCSDIGNQSLSIFERLGRVTVRDVVVDERMGIVMMRLSWNQRGPGSDKLTAWEMFKVYDGQIHMVEAYMRVFPPALDLGGWPIGAGISQP
jgi:hypothetical protein